MKTTKLLVPIISVAVLSGAAAPALSESVGEYPPLECEKPDGSYFDDPYPMVGGITQLALFPEDYWYGTVDRPTILLAHCESGLALEIWHENQGQPLDSAFLTVNSMIASSITYSFEDVRRNLTSEGWHADIRSIDADGCACSVEDVVRNN